MPGINLYKTISNMCKGLQMFSIFNIRSGSNISSESAAVISKTNALTILEKTLDVDCFV